MSRTHWLEAAIVAVGLACASNYPPPGYMVVERSPPDRRVEVIGVAPGNGQVWIGGFWRWSGNDYDWVSGRWVAVQPGYHTWVPGRWVRIKNGWYWREGYWR